MNLTTTPKPQTLWKLTNELSQSFGQTQWGPNVTHKAPGNGPLCSSAWLHAYTHPILALLMNPIHANFSTPQLWRSQGIIKIVDEDHEHKIGTRSLTTIELVPTPTITDVNRQAFAILCAQTVSDAQKEWTKWAKNWLSGKDRSSEAECRAYAQAQAHAHAQACAFACAHAHAYAYACAYAYAHTRARACALSKLKTTQAEHFADLAMTIN